MNAKTIPSGPALALVLVGIVAASALLVAQTQIKGPIQHFTAKAVNVTGAGDPVKIDLLRWSTDAERDELVSVLAEKGEKELASALGKAPTLGYLWTSESAGYSLRYAYRVTMAEGTERVIFATDRRLGSWNPQIWRPVNSNQQTEYPFTVIELRLNRKGEGEGKGSLTTKVTVDTQAKTITLDNYNAAPVVLQGVKRDGSGPNAN